VFRQLGVLLLIFGSSNRSVTDHSFQSEVELALASIQSDPRVADIETPYNAKSPALAQAQTSKDGHLALVRVGLKSTGQRATSDYSALRAKVHASRLSVIGTGNVPLNNAFSTTLESDLQRAETVSLPITLILLILIFGTVVAAGLPLGVAILTIVGGLAGTLILNRVTDVSQYALNIVTLIGLAVAIDYSLFVVNRFRDEHAAGASREDAIAKSMATAGRAITFSGLAVAVGRIGDQSGRLDLRRMRADPRSDARPRPRRAGGLPDDRAPFAPGLLLALAEPEAAVGEAAGDPGEGAGEQLHGAPPVILSAGPCCHPERSEGSRAR